MVADLDSFARMTWADPEEWSLGCWASNAHGYRSREVARFARQHPYFDPRSHIDLGSSCQPCSTRLSAAWETYVPDQDLAETRGAAQWNEAIAKRARRPGWSSSDGDVRMEAATPAYRGCRPVAAASFPACDAPRPP